MSPADERGTRFAEQAELWIASGERPPLEDAASALPIAWAIKDRSYAAWSSAPQTTLHAAAACDALVHAVDQLAPDSSTRDEVAAVAAWTRAIAQLVGGSMAEAIASLDQAAAGLDAVGRTAEAAQTRVPRVVALSMLGRHEEAVACATDAQLRFIALSDWRSAAKASLNLGSLQLRHDAYAEAARHYGEASVLFARVADREHSVMADIGSADALTALGRGDDAAHLYARARMRASTHKLPVLEALADESMALLDLVRGRYGDALRGLESARRRYETLGMPQHLAIAEKQLADAYLELRLLPEALVLLDAALTKMRELEMPEDEAWTLAQRGRVEALLGRRMEAYRSFEAATSLFVAQGLEVGLSNVALARAELSLAEGAADEAAELAAQAAAGFNAAGQAGGELRARITGAEARLAAGHSPTAELTILLEKARSAQMVGAQVRCLIALGINAERLGDAANARIAFETAVELFEAQRQLLSSDDLRIAYLTDNLRPYEFLLRFALTDDRLHRGAASASMVLHWLDRARASSLNQRSRRNSAEDAATSSAVATLRLRHQWLSRRLRQQQQAGEPSAGLESERADTERALLEQARRERLLHPLTPMTVTPRALDELPSRLASSEALVEYGILDGQIFAAVVRSSGVAVVHAVASLAAVAAAIQGLRFQVDTMRHGATRLSSHLGLLTARVGARLDALHSLLWQPVVEVLGECTRVLVVPPAALAAVPFAALRNGRAHLGEMLQLSVLPSAEWALRALSMPLKPIGPSACALVVMNEEGLAAVPIEAAAVGSCFPRTVTLSGAAATVEAMCQNAPGADVLHLACHADFRSDNPLFSALYLAGGALTAEQVEALPLSPGLTVLSACETARGSDAPGDEQIGLVRAFLASGMARVVATLWPVDDTVTGRFMGEFYGALARGDEPTRALQAAQAAVRYLHPHPWYWAGFVLYGGW